MFALAWSTTQRGGAWGWIEYARREAEKANVPGVRKPTRVLLPATVTASHLRLSNGQMVMVPEDRVVDGRNGRFRAASARSQLIT